MSDYDGMAVSFGGGVNSTAMVIMLAEQGWRGPIVFADTGAEWPETYCYMTYLEREYLAPRGLSITRISGPQWVKKRGGMSLIDYCEAAHVIPMAAVRWCTHEWKAAPIRRYLGDASQLIGIAADEAHRMPDAIRPLVDAGITRRGCIEIIQRAGLDVPQKSGCIICPFQRRDQWRVLWQRHPELWERVAMIEESVQRRKPRGMRPTLDIAGRYTLRDLQLSFESQIELPGFDDDDLLAYRPCVCGV